MAAHGNSPASFPDDGRPGIEGGLAATARAAAAGKNIEDHARLMVMEKRGLARSALLESLIGRITRDNWKAGFDVMWRARQEGMISEREEQLFLQRVGEVAGLSAMDQFKPDDPVKNWDTHSGRHAMRGWAQTDPVSAMAWLDSQPEGNFRTGMGQGFVRGCAAQDPKAALHVAAMLAPGDQQWLMNSLLSAEEAAHNLPFVQQWLTSGALAAAASESVQIKAEVFGLLVDTELKTLWNDRDGSRVSQWIEQFAGREFVAAPALCRLTESLARRMDAPSVIGLLERMAVPVLPGQVDPIGGVMQRWSRDDPGAAQEWLNDHRDTPNYDAAAFAFIQSAASADPAVQRAWIETLHDEGLRAQAMRRLDELQKAAAARK